MKIRQSYIYYFKILYLINTEEEKMGIFINKSEEKLGRFTQ